jgi:uncharacterized protein (DUF2236 family)
MRGIVPRVGADDEAQEDAFRAQYNRRVTTGQRVNAERLALLGWGRAVLLQLAHPLVAAGVAEHSSFRGGTAANVRRLHSTVRAMLDLSFGTPEDMRRAVGHINAIHDRVNGTLREAAGRFCAGTPYSANDPELLVWVDATVRDSMLLAYELFVGPLSAGDRDRYWVEGEDITTGLRVPADARIQSPSQFSRYFAEMLASRTLAVSTDARELAQEIVWPRATRALWPASHLHRATTVGLLPADLRDAYGLAWSDVDQRALQRWARLIRASRRLMPQSMALWPRARAVARDHEATSGTLY